MLVCSKISIRVSKCICLKISTARQPKLELPKFSINNERNSTYLRWPNDLVRPSFGITSNALYQSVYADCLESLLTDRSRTLKFDSKNELNPKYSIKMWQFNVFWRQMLWFNHAIVKQRDDQHENMVLDFSLIVEFWHYIFWTSTSTFT